MTTAALTLAQHLWWLAPIVAGAWLFTLGHRHAEATTPEPIDLLVDGDYWAAEFIDQHPDQQWADYLAALGLTPEQVRADWVRRQEQTW